MNGSGLVGLGCIADIMGGHRVWEARDIPGILFHFSSMTEIRRSERLVGRLPRPAVAPGPMDEYRYLFGERPLLEDIPEIYQRRANRFIRSTLPERRIPVYERKQFCECIYEPCGTCGSECRNRLERYESSSRTVYTQCARTGGYNTATSHW